MALALKRAGGTAEERDMAEETARAALKVVQKLQTGFGFAPDLYERIEMVKRTRDEGRAVVGLIKGFFKT